MPPSMRNLKAIRRARKREPQLVEGPKTLLILKGPTSSEVLNDVMRDVRALKAPEVKALSRKNDIRPFEDAASLEFLCDKNESAAFLISSHSKKRPHNLTFGRMFDRHLLDMVELGVTWYEPIAEIEGPKKLVGSSPLMVFCGDEWERSADLTRLRSLFLDIFGARDMAGVALAGVDHVIQLSVVDGAVTWRTYFVNLKKSDSRVPRVELQPMGPSLDFAVRRVHAPSSDLERASLKQPKQLGVGKTKNVETNVFGETLGRLHMERQDFSKLNQRKGRAVRAEKKRKAGDDDGAAAGGDAQDDAQAPELAAAAARAAAIEAAMGELRAEGDGDDDAEAGRKPGRRAKRARVTAKGSGGEFDA